MVINCKKNKFESIIKPLYETVYFCHQDDYAYYYKVDLPGFSKDEIEVVLSGNTIKITVANSIKHRIIKNDFSMYIDRPAKTCFINLKDNININKEEICASLEDGVLCLALPKLKQNPKKESTIKIEVK